MSTSPHRLVALRGATSVDRDHAGDIVSATEELLTAMLELNEVRHEDLVSLIFTSTPDLRSEFPAAAARAIGLAEVPLLCATEIAVSSAPPRCVRVLAHLYSNREPSALRHVYLREARGLREDLADRS